MKQLLTLPGEAEQFEHYGEVYVTRQAYADLNEHSALVEMNLQAQIDLNEAYEARLLAENERLRGIVQADIEEKAEAWGEVERLRADAERYRWLCGSYWFDDSVMEAEGFAGMEKHRIDAAVDKARGASPSPGTTQEGT